MRSARISRLVGLAVLIAGSPAAAGEACDKQYDSTFELIQHEIFEKRSCTSAACHGTSASGGLDLRAGASFDELVDAAVESIAAETHPGLRRVVPGRKDLSLLWLNLAGATLPELWTAPLNPMPQGLPPLTLDELEVVRLWIEEGATRDGVIPATAEILGACLPPPEPLKTEPLPPPPPGVGVQLRAPHQILPAESEREVCFVSYYDFTDQVPAGSVGPGGTTFRFKWVEGRQDPLSHHLVTIAYNGGATIDDPRWGAFTCKQGPRDGLPCDPTDRSACGESGLCGSEPEPALACNGFGPGDAGIGVGEESLFSTMSSAVAGVDGVYDEAPIKGIVVWNSHAFNVYDQPAHLDAWINFEFAAPDEQRHRLERFVDITAIAKMRVPPYGVEEVCHHHVVPPDVQLLELTSHVHQRGRRFRIFEGEFACQGGSNAGDPCSPYGPDAGLPVRDLCAGAPCASQMPPRVGDCDGDLAVTVDELVEGVDMALGTSPVTECPRFDGNDDGRVAIDELVAAVGAARSPSLRDPDESLRYVSVTYVDPFVLSLSPPLELGGVKSTRAERTLTYCALYDNGFSDPSTVKRRSRTPTNGVPCRATHCAEGRIGEPCVGQTDAARHTSCDRRPGARDGLCDACRAEFGVTTDDEMFVLIGSYVER